MRIYRADDLRKMLMEEAERAGSMRKYADRVGISESYLSLFLSGKRGPGLRLPRALGLEIVYTQRTSRRSS